MRIVSGGQTGVDRAALDAAIDARLPHGGWVPKGRLAEDGAIDSRYQVQETPSPDFAQRTEWNVRDSNATLIISRGPLAGGSALTERFARHYDRPLLHIDLNAESIPEAVERIVKWRKAIIDETLNVAGPRASEDPEIYDLARALTAALIAHLRR